MKREGEIKRWSIIFKLLGNPNRLKIVKILSKEDSLDVGAISEKLNISYTAISKHLISMQSLDVLNAVGKDNHVYYSLNGEMPQDFKKALSLFIK